ncbi:MAG: helix-turn-helix transcriptional regulator [bacterium]|nr:helix-turn-helix transcriptional regulator [bacterium]
MNKNMSKGFGKVLSIGFFMEFLKEKLQSFYVENTINSKERALKLISKFKISKREREVIQLILKGMSNKDIENELFISIKTVKCHIYNIYRKVGVKNRLQLINLFQGATV